MATVCKFYVKGVEDQGYSTEEGGEHLTGFKVNLDPVFRPKDPSHQNYKFWQASPQGGLWLQINNLQVRGEFRAGQEKYVIIAGARSDDGKVEGSEHLINELKALIAHIEDQRGYRIVQSEAGQGE